MWPALSSDPPAQFVSVSAVSEVSLSPQWNHCLVVELAIGGGGGGDVTHDCTCMLLTVREIQSYTAIICVLYM